jgi:nucleoside-diphosphate-sugar epimerase
MIAITGSSGFVGAALVAYLTQQKCKFRLIERDSYANATAFAGCDVVIHLAGLAHRRGSSASEYMAVNRDVAVACAKATAFAGVKRFIYVSSSKALCEFWIDETPLNETQTPRPSCDYGRSKFEAEQALFTLHQQGLIEVVVVRPALILGYPPKANLKAMAKAATRFYAPFCQFVLDLFPAHKSFTSLSDLCQDLLFLSQFAPAAGQIFHVSDPSTLSVGALFRKLRVSRSGAKNITSPAALTSSILPSLDTLTYKHLSDNAPTALLRAVLRVFLTQINRRQIYDALACPFVLDSQKINRQQESHKISSIDADIQRLMANVLSSGEGKKR